jgi:hypothetical protein
MEKFSLPARQYVIPHIHKYSVGDKVRNINNEDWNKYYGKEGTITKLLPFGTLCAAYDVLYDDKIAVALEISIERIDDGSSTKE